MTFELIQSFYTLAEYRSFTKAAEVLCISQSTLSHRLKLLEEDLGLKLIIRTRGNRSLELTPAGLNFISIAEQWISLEKSTRDFQWDLQQRILSVASVESLSYLFSGFYHKLTLDSDSNTPLFLEIYIFNSPHIIENVEKQELDIGFIVIPRHVANLKIEPIFHEKHYIIGNLGSDKSVLDPRKLDPQRELITSWSPDFMTWHNYYLGSRNHPLVTLDTVSMVPPFLTAGTWCIVPACAASYILKASKLYGYDAQLYELINPPPDRTCYKVTNRTPKLNRVENIHYFEDQILIYLRENDLHL